MRTSTVGQVLKKPTKEREISKLYGDTKRKYIFKD